MITHEDLMSYEQDRIQEEKESKERALKNECICGTINCATEYACHTSGY